MILLLHNKYLHLYASLFTSINSILMTESEGWTSLLPAFSKSTFSAYESLLAVGPETSGALQGTTWIQQAHDEMYSLLQRDHNGVVVEAKLLPGVLAFQQGLNLTVREQQLKDLAQLVPNEGKKPRSMILQRFMGSGKTLVIGTLLTFLKANRFRLSVLVPPTSMFETNAQSMSRRSCRLFGQRAHVITFDNSEEQMEEHRLEAIYAKLVKAMHQQEYVMMSPRTIQMMQNVFVHRLLNKCSSTSTRLLGKTLRLLRSRGLATFDEIDVTFDPKQERNMALQGTKKPADPLVLSLIVDLYVYLATSEDPKVKRVQILDNKQAEFGAFDELLPQLIKRAADYICSSNDWIKMTSACTSPAFSRESLESFLTHGAIYEEAWIKSLDGDLAERLALVLLQLHQNFRRTLSRTVNRHLGRSRASIENGLAIPYVAANTPNEVSSFADIWSLAQFTSLFYLNEGLDSKQTEIATGVWQKRLKDEDELRQKQRLDPPSLTEMHQRWQSFCPDCPDPREPVRANEVEMI